MNQHACWYPTFLSVLKSTMVNTEWALLWLSTYLALLIKKVQYAQGALYQVDAWLVIVEVYK